MFRLKFFLLTLCLMFTSFGNSAKTIADNDELYKYLNTVPSLSYFPKNIDDLRQLPHLEIPIDVVSKYLVQEKNVPLTEYRTYEIEYYSYGKLSINGIEFLIYMVYKRYGIEEAYITALKSDMKGYPPRIRIYYEDFNYPQYLNTGKFIDFDRPDSNHKIDENSFVTVNYYYNSIKSTRKENYHLNFSFSTIKTDSVSNGNFYAVIDKMPYLTSMPKETMKISQDEKEKLDNFIWHKIPYHFLVSWISQDRDVLMAEHEPICTLIGRIKNDEVDYVLYSIEIEGPTYGNLTYYQIFLVSLNGDKYPPILRIYERTIYNHCTTAFYVENGIINIMSDVEIGDCPTKQLLRYKLDSNLSWLN